MPPCYLGDLTPERPTGYCVWAEIGVKRHSLPVLILILATALCAPASDSKPVDPVQLTAWLAAGVPGQRLLRIVQECGIAAFLS